MRLDDDSKEYVRLVAKEMAREVIKEYAKLIGAVLWAGAVFLSFVGAIVGGIVSRSM